MDAFELVLSIGAGERGRKDDITIMKKDCQHLRTFNCPGNGCIQSSYEYYGIKNAFVKFHRVAIGVYIVRFF